MAQVKNKSMKILLNFSSWRQILPINHLSYSLLKAMTIQSNKNIPPGVLQKVFLWKVVVAVCLRLATIYLLQNPNPSSVFKPQEDKVDLVLLPLTWHRNHFPFNPPLLPWKVSLWGILLCGYFSEKEKNSNENKINSKHSSLNTNQYILNFIWSMK